MRTPHRFFSQEKLGQENSKLITNGPFVNQIKNVFRLAKDDKVILFDNSGYDFVCQIDGYENNGIALTIIEKKENVVLPSKETYLFASIVKKDNFEWIAQKATELGVSHIIPISSERSEKKDLNIERIQKIIIEAAEQSGRGTLPILHEIVDLSSALQNFSHIKSIAWDPQATKFVSQDISESLGAFIGPEGGWTSKELDMFKEHNIHIRSLGPQVLRSETAVIAVISHLVF